MKIKTSSNRFNSKTGVVKIVRASYSTKAGHTQVNSWWELRKKAWTRDQGKCVDHRRRGILVTATDVHHIVPLARGGTNTMSNLICLCDTCHIKRHPQNNHLKTYHRK